MNLFQGERLVKLAREVISVEFNNKKVKLPEDFNEKSGAFVTLHKFPNKELRGCIGFIEPIFSLKEAVVRAAKAAAFSDPRFVPLKEYELDNIIIEVSVLTKPELVKNLKKIKIGVDGLIIEADGHKGLLLPIVAEEYKWNVEEFLSQTCVKAGLSSNRWKQKNCKVYKFQTLLFQEKEPNGEVIEH